MFNKCQKFVPIVLPIDSKEPDLKVKIVREEPVISNEDINRNKFNLSYGKAKAVNQSRTGLT